ncbi:MAG: hypothetical protein HKP48_07680 [Winogradskyella sp.]|uniref:hypothetical protein n=1 Tax=Winogradskyella sp. TaxID=1883156 RepID=UPI00180CC289|nr:hypothetical protein [Winogradskyella sp.]MBT8244744.1 hypothetical protein [Winogradskyella sp.]NNK23162.1 hypothetical protein [Winogradskyella sp.]
MTSKQTERINNKIKKIKSELQADKRRWGGFYHDGGGLRYLPPELYLKLEDYTGALRYFNWFAKNFPDDIGYPIFLFEWTITLFKTKRIDLAEKKAIQTFASNTYIFDKFLQKESLQFEKSESSNWQSEQLVQHFKYSKKLENLIDFGEWLESFTKSEKFYDFANKFIYLRQKLENEPVGNNRSKIIERENELMKTFTD